MNKEPIGKLGRKLGQSLQDCENRKAERCRGLIGGLNE
jgi:hypothetical protein